MKKIIILLTVLCLISCKKEKEDYIILSGKIENQTQDYFVLTLNNTNEKDTIQISSTGDFIDTLRIENGSHLIAHGKVFFRPYFEKGHHLTINFNTSDLKNTLTYFGNGAHVNNYITAKRAKELKLIKNRKDFYSLDQEKYKETVTKIRDNSLKLLNESLNISDDYKRMEIKNIEYEYINNLLSFENFHRYFTKNQSFKVSEGFLPNLKDFNYNNGKDYLFSPAYKRILSNNLKNKITSPEQDKSLEPDILKLKEIANIKNDTIRNQILYSESLYGITYTKSLDQFYNIFINASTNEDHKQQISKSYNQLKKVSKGQPSPEFVDYVNYAGGTKSLSDFKGKYVYIDVWATWCAPCIKEIPALKEIEKKYHGKNIEFVSISIDRKSSFEKWKKMVAKENLGGVQLFADNDWNSEFIQNYYIKGIPRFILVDPQGNIVTSNAPRPSEKALINLFNELNI